MNSKESKKSLLIFIRNPELGKVKTRLAETLGTEKTLEIYQKLLLHTQNETYPLPVLKIIAYSDFIPLNDSWKRLQYLQTLQNGRDLGVRMKNAFEQRFLQGDQQVIIIGSDCIELTQSQIENAFVTLSNSDIVIGPAKDGGYYLLGMKKLHPDIFENKNWGSASVLKDTIQTIKNLELSYQMLSELNDIDNESDWNEYLSKQGQTNN